MNKDLNKKYSLVFEYIWLDVNNNPRSKTKIGDVSSVEWLNYDNKFPIPPEWNYDGSSTGQANTKNSEVILKPVKIVNDPFRNNILELSSGYNVRYYLVLCDCYSTDGSPLQSNTRANANSLFKRSGHLEPMFGLEQEFFISRKTTLGLVPIAFGDSHYMPEKQGNYYCGVGGTNLYGKNMMEEVLNRLLKAGLSITGLNAEVAPSQWEFQVCSIGIDAADSLILLRYICGRVLEKHGLVMDISAKPLKGEWNGSGCHINYSTNTMREEGGYKHIENAIKNLSENHMLHINNYGDDNPQRLTGEHETSAIDKFTYSVGGRHTSIRIPYSTKTNKCGYIEDRRPSSSIDPYKATSLLHATCNGIEFSL